MANPVEWLGNAVIYQIYPQSFQDSSGDGIGDFAGITRRLDYLADLGVDVLWMNPVFDSPFGDAGYDIRDFYRVAPRYGSEADLVSLIEAAHERGMRVLLDLVAGHTAMDHPWFRAEAAAPRHPESNRYIWKNRAFDPAVGPGRDDYVANFFWHQPALNYGYDDPQEAWQDPVDAPGPTRNRQELKRIMGYWFERGADGFRVDMAASLVKGQSGDQSPGTRALWQEIRSWLDASWPDRALAAEWSHPARSVAAGFHLDWLIHFHAPGYASLFFNGSGTLPAKEGPAYFDADGAGSLDIFREAYACQLNETRGRGFVSLPSACHDFQRPRCGPRGQEGLRPLWVFLLTQAGVPTIYYGDEIGMRFVPGTPPREGSTLQGIEAPNAGAPDGERSGTRTPMQWNDAAQAGFSTASADRLYLPLDPDPDRPNVCAQRKDPRSLWHFIRGLLQLRRERAVLGSEADYWIRNAPEKPYPLWIERELDGDRVWIVINPSRKPVALDLPEGTTTGSPWLAAGLSLPASASARLNLAPFGYAIMPVR